MRGYILVFLAAAMWGTLGIFAKFLYQYNLSTYTIIFYRVFFAVIFLFAYLKVKGIDPFIERERIRFYLAYAFFSIFLFYALYFYTVKISSVSFAVLMLYTAPAYSVLFGRLIFKEKITPTKLLAVALVITGVVLLNTDSITVSKLAIATGLASGLTYSLYGVFSKMAVRKEEPEKALFNVLLIGMLFLIPFTDFRVPTGAIPYLVALAFFPTFLGYILYNTALKTVEISRASVIATIEPVVAMTLAFLIFGERLTVLQIIGAGLIITGAILVQITPSYSRQS
ncbi:carboxylate/amino acid/amine transporter [Thermococcus chitonophagus]|uniref:Permease of the drug/metabolite transporter (DMT) superfamily n=1 Tax=Thermococcus chitonophagus TaxID=54262 RepID=A0A160VQH5_9EURY|nr:carboxylate/amino acid/amine transporter [Thermococcus chitonophagus]CUX76950.1 Permease of the drug/metabolite transporter (DMT) superfamily [Thermococcus chitonophagus]